jgi:hypothetical protein
VLPGDEPPSAYLHVRQIPAPHLVIQQVPGQSGQASRLIDRIGQPFGRRIWPGERAYRVLPNARERKSRVAANERVSACSW